MSGIIIGGVIAVAIVAGLVVFLMRRGGGASGDGRALRKLADVRGWHYSRPDAASESYGLSGDSMLRGADGGALDWRVRWHFRTTRAQGKDKTEFKCADVGLDQGWVFVDPHSHAGEIKARQRVGMPANASDAVNPAHRKPGWRDALPQAREMSVGTSEFLAQFFVCATVKESLVRRLLPQRMQKALLAAPHSGHLSIRMGTEGVVITCPAEFNPDRVVRLIELGEILVSSVAQEQTSSVVA